MRSNPAPRRSAFTLLEMVLALSIAMILLLALYLTLSTQVTNSQIGRDTLAEGEVARSILTRIGNDVANQLGPMDPRGLPDYSSTTAPSTSSATPSATEATPMPTTDVSNTIEFNSSIQGGATWLIISGYRVQKQATGSADASSDLRRVAIWLATNGSDPIGLARHELKQATCTDLDIAPTDLPNQDKLVFAKEIQNVLFEYFDGTAWQSEWDGAALAGEDGLSRVGPPAAIRVTITMRKYNDPTLAASSGNEPGPTYQHIIALPTSNNFIPKTTTP